MGGFVPPGGGGGSQGPPGQGVPTGGAPGEVLTKATSANYDTIWRMPVATVFNFTTQFSVLGTEASGARLPDIVIPAASLPLNVFSWAVEGSGYGTFFATNRGPGVTGSPTGNFYLDIWESGGWVQTATQAFTNLGNPEAIIIRSTPTSPGGTRVFTYDSAVLAEIRFSMRVNSAPTTAYTMTIGLQGLIVG